MPRSIHRTPASHASWLLYLFQHNIPLRMVRYWVSISFYNFCGLAVAKKLSSVHR